MLTRRLEETSWIVETRKSENRPKKRKKGKKKKKVVSYGSDKEYPLESRYLPITVLVFCTSIYVLIGCEIRLFPMWVGVIHNSFIYLFF